jgi:hypothetical protein
MTITFLYGCVRGRNPKVVYDENISNEKSNGVILT